MGTAIVPEVAGPHASELQPERLLGWRLPRGPVEDERTLQRVLERLQRTVVDPALLRPWVRFDPAGYVRVRLYRDAVWELLLLCWLPGQASTVHGHGDSSGATLVVAGELTERRYRLGEEGRVVPAGLHLAQTGDTLVETLATIHRVENRGRAPALSLHLYAPPLDRLVSYDLER